MPIKVSAPSAKARAEATADMLRAAMSRLDTNSAGLALILGFPPERGSRPIDDVMALQAPLGSSARRALAYVLKFGPITHEEAEAELRKLTDVR